MTLRHFFIPTYSLDLRTSRIILHGSFSGLVKTLFNSFWIILYYSSLFSAVYQSRTQWDPCGYQILALRQPFCFWALVACDHVYVHVCLCTSRALSWCLCTHGGLSLTHSKKLLSAKTLIMFLFMILFLQLGFLSQ